MIITIINYHIDIITNTYTKDDDINAKSALYGKHIQIYWDGDDIYYPGIVVGKLSTSLLLSSSYLLLLLLLFSLC